MEIKINSEMKKWFLVFDEDTNTYNLKHVKDFDFSDLKLKEVKRIKIGEDDYE